MSQCPSCGYDLRGHDEPARCPECGQAIEPGAFEIHLRPDIGGCAMIGCATLFVIVPLFLLAPRIEVIIAGTLILICAFGLWLLVRAARGHRPPRLISNGKYVFIMRGRSLIGRWTLRSFRSVKIDKNITGRLRLAFFDVYGYSFAVVPECEPGDLPGVRDRLNEQIERARRGAPHGDAERAELSGS